ncbi:glucokinase regulatory protein isoform X1 [Tachysurus ichikawai]
MQHWQQSCYEPYLPITEKSNPITRDIDRANPKEIVQMLQKCDAEIFERTSYGNPMYQTLNSLSVVQTIVDVSKRVEVFLKDPEDSLIILSGCGTSGRVAFLLATSLNRLLASQNHKQIYSYIIAGGDKALLTSQETPEDDPLLGALSLDKACVGKKHVLFIGISCGLSAPFVAGQLDFCLRNLEIFTPVLIGFNPIDMARTEPIKNCSFHFKEVAERMNEMQTHQKAYMLNPAVGPEAISGSSRMKGGSATKIIMETILLAGHQAAYNNEAVTLNGILHSLNMFEKVHQITYSQTTELAALVQKAAISLRRKGHVYYLGWQTLGIIGIIDASECIPTFGAGFEDIRGFVSNGFIEMNNKEGDLSSLGPHFIIGHKDFIDSILPNVSESESDTVIFLYSENVDLNEVSALAKSVRQRTSNLHAITHEHKGLSDPERMKSLFMTVLTFNWPSSLYMHQPVLMKQYWELSTKWCLNAISTGAHVLIGKTYMNYMIDLRVTNSKLYRRAIHILQRFTGSTLSQCETALLRALYDVEELSDEMSSTDVTQHTVVANEKGNVVPIALVMLQTRRTIAKAKSYLNAYSVIRDAVAACQRLL